MRYIKKGLLFDRCCRLYISVLVVLAFAGCDDSFQPLQQDEQYSFSIYGYLDASADTQWVRVTPAREQLHMPPEIPEMYITLEHLESGATKVMNASLIEFIFPTGFNAINAWSDMALEPRQSYRLKAERPDGKSSSVTVTLPEDFPTPRLRQIPGFDNSYILYINGIDRLVSIEVRRLYRIRWAGRVFEKFSSVQFRNRADRVGPGEYTLYISPSGTPGPLPEGAVIENIRQQIFVVSGGPEWDEEIISLDDLSYFLPDVASNVEDGIGYLVGIISKSIPFKSCFSDDDPSELIACPEVKPF